MKDDTISRQAVLKLLSTMPPEEAMTKAMLIQSVKQMDAVQSECDKEFVMLKVIDLNGRPYYSIIYLENGNEFEGYSSYDLKVISEYLKKYFGFAQPEDVQKIQDLEQAQFDKIRELAYQEGKADAVAEIIRCRDCKLRDTEYCNMAHGFMGMKDDDYCSYAERREVSE